MGVIQVKDIEFCQDDRGWCIRPISDDDIENIGNDVSHLFCFSYVQDGLKDRDITNNKIINK